MNQVDPNYDPTNIDDEAFDKTERQFEQERAAVNEHVIMVRPTATLEAIFHDGSLESAARIVNFLKQHHRDGFIEKTFLDWTVRASVNNVTLRLSKDDWLLVRGESFIPCRDFLLDKMYERVEVTDGG